MGEYCFECDNRAAVDHLRSSPQPSDTVVELDLCLSHDWETTLHLPDVVCLLGSSPLDDVVITGERLKWF